MCADFKRLDLLALYITMYLKRVVVNKLPWKENLEILFKEVKPNLERFGNSGKNILVSILCDFARIYGDQWSIKQYGEEFGQPTYHTLLLVLILRLGSKKLWVPDSVYFREDILIEGFLSHKPDLLITYLNQSEPLYDVLIPLCQNLHQVSLPLSDNASFLKAVAIKTLRVLEFSTCVADKVICNAFWSVDKKSDKLLQVAVKEKDGLKVTLALPHLEVFRSNLLCKSYSATSLKVTLGAVALLLQPKLHTVENKHCWSTLQSVEALIEAKSKIKLANHKHRLKVKRLVFDRNHLNFKEDLSSIPEVIKLCPEVDDVIFPNASFLLLDHVRTIQKNLVKNIKKLALDTTSLADEEIGEILVNLGPSVEHMSLRVSMAFVKNFCSLLKINTVKSKILPCLKSLSLVLTSEYDTPVFSNCSNKNNLLPNTCGQSANFMMCFFSWFTHVESLHLFNVYFLSPPFLVYECVGGAMAVMENLKHLSLNGTFNGYLSEEGKLAPEEAAFQISKLLPNLLADSMFKALRTLKSFSFEENLASSEVDHFVEILRSNGVHVIVKYQPQFSKDGYLPCSDDFDQLYSPINIEDLSR